VDTDEGALRIDASTGQSTRASGSPLDPARPAWAPIDAGQVCPHATCRESAPMPIPDMNVDHVYLDGASEDAVAVGQKQTGTHLPMLAGISIAKKATRWSRVLQTSGAASLDEPVIARGRIYFEYGDGPFRHLVCASVATGELVWDAKSEENARAARRIVAGEAVYVVRTGKVEEYDAKDGKLLARFP
jgi:outer membrane protein assembly factor BamB